MVSTYETIVSQSFEPKPQKVKPYLVWQPKYGFENYGLRGQKVNKIMVLKTFV